MVARRGGTSTTLGRLAVQVVPPGSDIRRSVAKPVFDGCAEAPSRSGETLAGLGLALPSTAAPAVSATHDRPHASLRPPRFHVPLPSPASLASGGFPWFAALFYTVLALLAATLLLFVLRFFTESWNP
jgi:hypothetical protein